MELESGVPGKQRASSELEKEENCLKLLDALIAATKKDYHEVIENRTLEKQRRLQLKSSCKDSDGESDDDDDDDGCSTHNVSKIQTQRNKQAAIDERIRSAIRADEDKVAIGVTTGVPDSSDSVSSVEEPSGTHNADVNESLRAPTKEPCGSLSSDDKLHNIQGAGIELPVNSNSHDTTMKTDIFHPSLNASPRNQQKIANVSSHSSFSEDHFLDSAVETQPIEQGKVQVQMYEKIISNLLQERQKNIEIVLELRHQINVYERKFQDLEKLSEVSAKYECLLDDVSKLQKELQIFHLREQIYQSFLAKTKSNSCQIHGENDPKNIASDNDKFGAQQCNSSNLSQKMEPHRVFSDLSATGCSTRAQDVGSPTQEETGCSKMPANQVLQIVQHLQKTIIEQGNEIKNLRSTFAKMT